MISAVGVRNVVENQVDFTKSRNIIIAALIMGLSLGINFSAAGAIAFSIGSVNISLSGLAVASLVGQKVVSGANGMLLPNANVSRAEVAKLLVSMW